MEKYEIEYEYTELATVLIDVEKSKEVIKEMVEFWCGWEERLKEQRRSYIDLWLEELGWFILNHDRPPEKDDEGWYPMDGTYGITLERWENYEFNRDEILIKKIL